MPRRKALRIPDAVLDKLLTGAGPKTIVDGLKGCPEAIIAVFLQATVQTCIVHLLRHSLDFVSWKDRKPVAAALKDIYRAVVPPPAKPRSPPSRRATCSDPQSSAGGIAINGRSCPKSLQRI
jgi:hypothetical protein